MAGNDVLMWLNDNELKITKAQLQEFLKKVNLPSSGNKSQLIQRVKCANNMGYSPESVNYETVCDTGNPDSSSMLITPLGEQLPDPSSLSTGWNSDASVFPHFTDKELYNFLVLSRKTFDKQIVSAKKELTKASVFYENGHVLSLQYHAISQESSHCFVRCKCLPSFPGKKKEYDIWVCLSKFSSMVHSAFCDCDAGHGQSCNHVAALLFALVDNTKQCNDGKLAPTAKACSWIVPRKRKLSPKRSQDMSFSSTSRPTTSANKPPVQSIEKVQAFRMKLAVQCPKAAWLKNFTIDKPALSEYHVSDLPALHHIDMCFHDSVDLRSSVCVNKFALYFQSLSHTQDECVKIFDCTRGQGLNDAWMTARNGRLTASKFGKIVRRKPSTSPDNLLKVILQYSVPYQGEATRHGLRYESIARDNYLMKMKEQHPPFKVVDSGLCVNSRYPHLGASPDGLCSCAHCDSEGLVEIKCPFNYRHIHPVEAAKSHHSNFYCDINSNGTTSLKNSHLYYYQVQGQMGITNRKWCDFVTWTFKGMTIERIQFDESLWLYMLDKLNSFYFTALLPELFSERVRRGKSLYL